MEGFTASIKLRTIEEADRLFMDMYRETTHLNPVELSDPNPEGFRVFRVEFRGGGAARHTGALYSVPALMRLAVLHGLRIEDVIQ